MNTILKAILLTSVIVFNILSADAAVKVSFGGALWANFPYTADNSLLMLSTPISDGSFNYVRSGRYSDYRVATSGIQTFAASGRAAISGILSSNHLNFSASTHLNWSRNGAHDYEYGIGLNSNPRLVIDNQDSEPLVCRISIFATDFAESVVTFGSTQWRTGAGSGYPISVTIPGGLEMVIDLTAIKPAHPGGVAGTADYTAAVSVDWYSASAPPGGSPAQPIRGVTGYATTSSVPVVPTVPSNLVGDHLYRMDPAQLFSGIETSHWVTVPIDMGVQILMTSNQLCSAVTFPPAPFFTGPLNLNYREESLGEILPGQTVDFVQRLGHSVSEFVLTGFDRAASVQSIPLRMDFAQTNSSFAAMPLRSANARLIHRYSFGEGSDSTNVFDSIGGSHGTLINSAGTNFNGRGQLGLPGKGISTFVSLPSGIVSSLQAVSIEGWITWDGPASALYQRIFDFGSSLNNEGFAFICLTTAASNKEKTPLLAIRHGFEPINPQLDSTIGIQPGTPTHFVVVYNPIYDSAKLYLNGQLTASGPAPFPLSSIEDANAWLGRSQWPNDEYFSGSYDEFRIYEGALTDSQIADNFAAGPDVLPLQPLGLDIALLGSNFQLSWPADIGAFYKLESVEALSGEWTPVSATLSTNRNRIEASIPAATTNSAYFRLRK